MNRLSEYRIMWVMVLFDLPTTEAKDRKAAAQFRKDLQQDGFIMFQYSIYVRHCSSKENANAHIKRIKACLPPQGDVCIFCVTDKQFGDIEVYHSLEPRNNSQTWQQLELF